MHLDAPCSGTLTIYRHFTGVASECCDIILHPAQCEYLILKPDIEITEQWVRSELRVSEETEGVQPVIYGDDNNVRGLIDPMLKWPVSRVTRDVTCNSSILTHA